MYSEEEKEGYGVGVFGKRYSDMNHDEKRHYWHAVGFAAHKGDEVFLLPEKNDHRDYWYEFLYGVMLNYAEILCNEPFEAELRGLIGNDVVGWLMDAGIYQKWRGRQDEDEFRRWKTDEERYYQRL